MWHIASPVRTRRPRVPWSLWLHSARSATRKVRSQGNWRAPRVTVTRGLELRGPLPQDRQVAPWAPSRAVGRGRRAGLRGYTETEARQRRRRGQRENEGHSPASAQSTPYTGSNRSPVARVRKREWREAFPLAEGTHEAGSRRPMSLSLCLCHLSGNGFVDFRAETHRSVCGFWYVFSLFIFWHIWVCLLS